MMCCVCICCDNFYKKKEYISGLPEYIIKVNYEMPRSIFNFEPSDLKLFQKILKTINFIPVITFIIIIRIAVWHPIYI